MTRISRNNNNFRNRRASNATRRANGNVTHMLHSSTIRVNGNIDPKPVDNSVNVTKTIQLNQTPGTGGFSMTPATLAAALPGGASVWKSLRLVKFSVYGTDAANLSVTMSGPGVIPGGDSSNFYDSGVAGNRRSQLHLSPSFQTRNAWLASDSTSTYCVIAGPTPVIIQATLEARAPGAVPA